MEEVVSFFAEEGMTTVRFNLMVPDGRGKDIEQDVTADKLFQAKATVLDFMLHTKGESLVDITLIDSMKRFVKANGAPASFEYHGCESFYCQAGRSLYSYNPDGKFYACDRIAEHPSWAMGSVNRPFGNTQKVIAQKQRSAFHHKDEWWSRCEGCDAKKICEFSCSAYYVHEVDTREAECQYTKKLWSHLIERKEEVFDFMSGQLPPVFIDEKRPKSEQNDQKRLVREMANDVVYNQLSLTETLAQNDRFQVLKRKDQYFLYVFGRRKVFEVDEIVAQIARFNGCLPPATIEQSLEGRFEAQKLGEVLRNLESAVPELFFHPGRTTPSQFPAASSLNAL